MTLEAHLSPAAEASRELLLAFVWGAGLFGIAALWWLNAS